MCIERETENVEEKTKANESTRRNEGVKSILLSDVQIFHFLFSRKLLWANKITICLQKIVLTASKAFVRRPNPRKVEKMMARNQPTTTELFDSPESLENFLVFGKFSTLCVCVRVFAASVFVL